MQYKRISADCHLDLPWLPAELFVAEAKRELKDRMPYVEDGPDGPRWITKAGVEMGLVGGTGSVGGKFVPGQNYRVDKMAETGLYEDGKRGVRRPATPISGSRTWTATGSTPRSSSASSASPRGSATPKLPTRCCASTTTGSRISAAIIPTARSASPVCPMATSTPPSKEVYRVARLGLKGLELSCSWDMEPMWHPVWEPLWKAVNEVQLPLHFHTFPTTSPKAREMASGQTRAGRAVHRCGRVPDEPDQHHRRDHRRRRARALSATCASVWARAASAGSPTRSTGWTSNTRTASAI